MTTHSPCTLPSSTPRMTLFRANGRPFWTLIALALAIGGLSSTTLLAGGAERYDRGRENHWGKHDNRYHDRNWQHHRRYRYAQPVYVPPLVYFEPRQSPGISLFFPLDFQH